MSKVLGIGVDGNEVREYHVRLMCNYLMSGRKIRKEAEVIVTTTSRETAVEIAIKKTKKQLEEFPCIQNVGIEPVGKKRGRR